MWSTWLSKSTIPPSHAKEFGHKTRKWRMVTQQRITMKIHSMSLLFCPLFVAKSSIPPSHAKNKYLFLPFSLEWAIIYWFSIFSSPYSLKIKAILSFNNLGLTSKKRKINIYAYNDGEVLWRCPPEMSNTNHIKAVRPPLLLCLSYAVLNLSTSSFIALHEDRKDKKEHSLITCSQGYTLLNWKCSHFFSRITHG